MIYKMKTNPSTLSRPSTSFVCSLLHAALLPLLLVLLTGQPGNAGTKVQPAGTIEVVTVFDFPKANTDTYPEDINDAGDIVGDIVPVYNLLQSRGFFRHVNAKFGPPILEPDARGYTETYGLNNVRLVCGNYYNPTEQLSHAYFFSTGTGFSQFDVPGATGTFVFNVNDVADFCGVYDDATGATQAFISIAGTITTIAVPGAAGYAIADDINNAGDIAGYYRDSADVYHGFLRAADGTITAPIDVSGSTYTDLRGINDHGLMVGRYRDSTGTHGFALNSSGAITTFIGESSTTLNGVNNSGRMCGWETDPDTGIHHGLIARLR